MKRIEDASSESLLPFVEECIEPGSVVQPTAGQLTPGWQRKATSIRSRVSRHKQSASELMPRVHRVMCSSAGCWAPIRAPAQTSGLYLDEFTFRFNRRKSKSRGKLFYRLVQQAVAVDPATYKMIVHPVTEPKKIPKPQDIGVT